MRQREVLARSSTPQGEPLTLTHEHGDHVVRVRNEILMSSRMSGSEQAMAQLALDCGVSPSAARVMVGGLGIGFTLRAVLDVFDADAQVEVVELLGDVVQWNRELLGHYANHPLDDPRVHTHVADLLTYLADAQAGFDAILLDIDNGPEAFTVASNDRLYAPTGLALVYAALRPGGVLVVWSAFRSRRFEQALRRCGFEARSVTTRARAQAGKAGGKGARHTLFAAQRPRGKGVGSSFSDVDS